MAGGLSSLLPHAHSQCGQDEPDGPRHAVTYQPYSLVTGHWARSRICTAFFLLGPAVFYVDSALSALAFRRAVAAIRSPSSNSGSSHSDPHQPRTSTVGAVRPLPQLVSPRL